jgi:hypothetical protein
MLVFTATLILGMIFLLVIKATRTMAAVKSSEDAIKYYARMECLGAMHDSEFPAALKPINYVHDISELTLFESFNTFTPVCACGSAINNSEITL